MLDLSGDERVDASSLDNDDPLMMGDEENLAMSEEGSIASSSTSSSGWSSSGSEPEDGDGAEHGRRHRRRGNMHNQVLCYPWKRTGELVEFEISHAVVKHFWGVASGDRVQITKGAGKGTTATIIGVRNSFLWRHDDTETPGAGAFNAYTRAELNERYGLVVVGTTEVHGIRRAPRRQQHHGDDPELRRQGAKTSAFFDEERQSAWLTDLMYGIRAPVRFHIFATTRKNMHTFNHMQNGALRRIKADDYLIEYESEPRVLRHHGFQSGDVVMFAKGPNAGQVATIVGAYRGKLAYHIDGQLPSLFDGASPMSDHGPVLINKQTNQQQQQHQELSVSANSKRKKKTDDPPSTTIPPYPADHVTLGAEDYITKPSFLASNYGLLYGYKMAHFLGPRQGTTGFIVGVSLERTTLVEFNINAGRILELKGRNFKELRANHGLKLVGITSRVALPLPAPAYSLTSRAAAPTQSSESPPASPHAGAALPLLLDIRASVNGRYLAQHGQAIKVTCGPRFGAVGRVAGVRDERQYAIFDPDRGPEPIEEEEEVVVLGRPAEPLLTQDVSFSKHHHHSTSSHNNNNRQQSSQHHPVLKLAAVTVFKELVEVDISPQGCAPYGLYFSQLIGFARRSDLSSSSLSNWCVDAKEEASAALLSPGWRRGVVAGVWRGELWVVDEATELLRPLEGTCAVDIERNYLLAVLGIPSANPIRSFFDPFLSLKHPHIQPHVHEHALQHLTKVLLYRCVDTAPSTSADFEELDESWCLSSSRVLALSKDPASFKRPAVMASVGQQCLEAGMRLRVNNRIKPKAVHVMDPDGKTQLTQWEAYSKSNQATVMGVACGRVYVAYDFMPSVAVWWPGGNSVKVDVFDAPSPTSQRRASAVNADKRDDDDSESPSRFADEETGRQQEDEEGVRRSSSLSEAAPQERVSEGRKGCLTQQPPKEQGGTVVLLDPVQLPSWGKHHVERRVDLLVETATFRPYEALSEVLRLDSAAIQRELDSVEEYEVRESLLRYSLFDVPRKRPEVKGAGSGSAAQPLERREESSSRSGPTYLLEVVEWVLKAYGTQLNDYDDAVEGMRRLCAVERCLGTTIPVPTYAQLHHQQRVACQQREDVLRDRHAAEEREDRNRLVFTLKTTVYRLSMFGASSHAPNKAEGEASNSNNTATTLARRKSNAKRGEQEADDAEDANGEPAIDDELIKTLLAENEEGVRKCASFANLKSRRSLVALRSFRSGMCSNDFAPQIYRAMGQFCTPSRPKPGTSTKRRKAATHDASKVNVSDDSPSLLAPAVSFAAGNGDDSFSSSANSDDISESDSGEEFASDGFATGAGPTAVARVLPSSHFHRLLLPFHWPMRYITVEGKQIVLDVSNSATKPFGMCHGQVYRVTRGDLQGTEVTILGVHKKRLYRYSNQCEALPFSGTHFKEIVERHGLELVCAVSPVAVRRCDPFFFHTTTGELVEFAVDEAHVAPFGVRFGERYLSRSMGKSFRITIIGVRDARVWYARDWGGARAFDGRDIHSELQSQFLYVGDVLTAQRYVKEQRDLRGSDGGAVVGITPNVTDARGTAAAATSTSTAGATAATGSGGSGFPPVAVYTLSGGSRIALDITVEACQPFGLFPGQQILHISGPLIPQKSVIAGVANGKLYRTVSGEKSITAFDASDPVAFKKQHAFRIVHWGKPAIVDVATEECLPFVHRQQMFRYRSMVGDLCLFDAREQPCRAIFGFSHGDKVLMRRPKKAAGKTAIIVGVRQGSLWKVDEGANVATMFLGCRKMSTLMEEHDLLLIGKTQLMEHVG